MNTPLHEVISPNYNEAELKKRTDAFLAEQGSWARLVQAQREMTRILTCNFFSRDGYEGAPLAKNEVAQKPNDFDMAGIRPCYKSHHAGLDMDEVSNLLDGHFGLCGEVYNGPEAFRRYVDVMGWEPGRALSSEEIAAGFVHEFAEHSELCKPYRAEHTIALAIGLPKRQGDEVVETARQALFRCAEEVEKWVSVNAEVIPDIDQQRLSKELYAYRAALMECCNYVDYAKGYLAYRDGPAKIQEQQPSSPDLPAQ